MISYQESASLFIFPPFPLEKLDQVTTWSLPQNQEAYNMPNVLQRCYGSSDTAGKMRVLWTCERHLPSVGPVWLTHLVQPPSAPKSPHQRTQCAWHFVWSLSPPTTCPTGSSNCSTANSLILGSWITQSDGTLQSRACSLHQSQFPMSPSQSATPVPASPQTSSYHSILCLEPTNDVLSLVQKT